MSLVQKPIPHAQYSIHETRYPIPHTQYLYPIPHTTLTHTPYPLNAYPLNAYPLNPYPILCVTQIPRARSLLTQQSVVFMWSGFQWGDPAVHYNDYIAGLVG